MSSTDDPLADDTPADGPPTDDRPSYELVGIVVLALLVLVYGVVVSQDALTWVGIAVPFVALYLFWRFVRAHERIADALE